MVTRGCQRTVKVGFEIAAVADETTEVAEEEASDAASLTSSTTSARTTAAARAAVAIWEKRMVESFNWLFDGEGNSSCEILVLRPKKGGGVEGGMVFVGPILRGWMFRLYKARLLKVEMC